mgnify:CR=1 FL=1
MERSPVSDTIRVSQQALFEVKVDPGVTSAEEELKEQARLKAIDQFYDTQRDLQSHATILNDPISD